jgi:hypothetical protein
MKKCELTQAGCRFVSSFFIPPSSFVFLNPCNPMSGKPMVVTEPPQTPAGIPDSQRGLLLTVFVALQL